jgi:hypothetical protein
VTCRPNACLRNCTSICYAKINTMCGQGLFDTTIHQPFKSVELLILKFTWFKVLITIMCSSIILFQALFFS